MLLLYLFEGKLDTRQGLCLPATLGWAPETAENVCYRQVLLILWKSIVIRMNYQATKGAKKHSTLCKSVRLQFISLDGLAKYTEP